MNTPLHLQLAYAHCYQDAYRDAAPRGSTAAWFSSVIEAIAPAMTVTAVEKAKVEVSPREVDVTGRSPLAPSIYAEGVDVLPVVVANSQQARGGQHRLVAVEAVETTQVLLNATVIEESAGRDATKCDEHVQTGESHSEEAVEAAPTKVRQHEVNPDRCSGQDESLAEAVRRLTARLEGCAVNGMAIDDMQQQLRIAAGPLPVEPVPITAATEVRMSADAKEEMAMYLYELRERVVNLREQLNRHEEAHYRRLNAERGRYSGAAEGNRRNKTKQLRVVIVRDYDVEPQPYPKGPWKPANFAAAAPLRKEATRGATPKAVEFSTSYNTTSYSTSSFATVETNLTSSSEEEPYSQVDSLASSVSTWQSRSHTATTIRSSSSSSTTPPPKRRADQQGNQRKREEKKETTTNPRDVVHRKNSSRSSSSSGSKSRGESSDSSTAGLFWKRRAAAMEAAKQRQVAVPTRRHSLTSSDFTSSTRSSTRSSSPLTSSRSSSSPTSRSRDRSESIISSSSVYSSSFSS